MHKSSVFEETYSNYLSQIGRLDFKQIADRLGAEMVGEELITPFFGKPIRISAAGISEPSGGRPNFSVCVVLFKYLLLCPDHDPTENDWVSFKDFKDSAPFAGAFFNYTEVPLAKYFSGRLKDLAAACQGIQGHSPAAAFSYDLCMQFNALPKIPVLLLFNDADQHIRIAFAVTTFDTQYTHVTAYPHRAAGFVINTGSLGHIRNTGVKTVRAG